MCDYLLFCVVLFCVNFYGGQDKEISVRAYKVIRYTTGKGIHRPSTKTVKHRVYVPKKFTNKSNANSKSISSQSNPLFFKKIYGWVEERQNGMSESVV